MGKVAELLEKVNGHSITEEEWKKVSEYAKYDLKRKVRIIIDEVMNEHNSYYDTIGESLARNKWNFWKSVKNALEMF